MKYIPAETLEVHMEGEFRLGPRVETDDNGARRASTSRSTS